MTTNSKILFLSYLLRKNVEKNAYFYHIYFGNNKKCYNKFAPNINKFAPNLNKFASKISVFAPKISMFAPKEV